MAVTNFSHDTFLDDRNVSVAVSFHREQFHTLSVPSLAPLGELGTLRAELLRVAPNWWIPVGVAEFQARLVRQMAEIFFGVKTTVCLAHLHKSSIFDELNNFWAPSAFLYWRVDFEGVQHGLRIHFPPSREH